MSDARNPMTAGEFIAWAMTRPETERYELVAGEIIAMAPGQSAHGLAKSWIANRLMNAISAANLPCDVYVGETSVRIDDNTVYEPDVLLRCGPRLAADATQVTDPVAVIEILPPSPQGPDRAAARLDDYVRLPSVVHYLIVKTGNRTIIHHHRANETTISTRIIRDGPVRLDPPGVTLDSAFPPDRPSA